MESTWEKDRSGCINVLAWIRSHSASWWKWRCVKAFLTLSLSSKLGMIYREQVLWSTLLQLLHCPFKKMHRTSVRNRTGMKEGKVMRNSWKKDQMREDMETDQCKQLLITASHKNKQFISYSQPDASVSLGLHLAEAMFERKNFKWKCPALIVRVYCWNLALLKSTGKFPLVLRLFGCFSWYSLFCLDIFSLTAFPGNNAYFGDNYM